MKLLVIALLAAAVMFLMPPAASAAESPRLAALIIYLAEPAVAVSEFTAFYREFRAMLLSWWDHSGQANAEGRWQVVAAAVALPGEPRTRFVVSVAEERGSAWHLVFTFIAPAPAQPDAFLAAHAAYDAAAGAILGQLRGTRWWLGPGGGETAYGTNPRGWCRLLFSAVC